MKSQTKKPIKQLGVFLLTIIIFSTVLVFVALFFNKQISFDITQKQPNQQMEQTNNKNRLQEGDEWFRLPSNWHHNAQLQTLVNYDFDQQSYYFDLVKIEQNLFNILNNALQNHHELGKNNNQYTKTIRYIVVENQQALVVNFLLKHKLVQNKKYKNYLKLAIRVNRF